MSKKLNKESHEHSIRVMLLAVSFAKNKLNLSDYEIEVLRIGSLYHDIGKAYVDQSVLSKKGKLSSEELAEIKRHSLQGYEVAQSFICTKEILSIILDHHEKLDGSGYPNQKAGEEISFLTRIVTICDIYDAMTNNRCYRNALTPEMAIEELEKCSESQLDKNLVKAFIDYIREGFELNLAQTI